jgi:hypothetical protein
MLMALAAVRPAAAAAPWLSPPFGSPLSSWDTLFAIGYFYIYASDVLLNFCVAYYSEEGELVTDMRSIASEQ